MHVIKQSLRRSVVVLQGIGAKSQTLGLERCLAGAHHSSSAQWVVKQDNLAESKPILAESDLILTTQVDRLKAFRG
jgi:hypothetical protein